MAELSTEDRQRIWRGLMRYWSNARTTLADYSKADLQAAINATDIWIDDNQVAYNSSLPNPFKTQATDAEKSLMFCAVTMMRMSPGLANLLRRALGVEVD